MYAGIEIGAGRSLKTSSIGLKRSLLRKCKEVKSVGILSILFYRYAPIFIPFLTNSYFKYGIITYSG
jgi:hypothetical protein